MSEPKVEDLEPRDPEHASYEQHRQEYERQREQEKLPAQNRKPGHKQRRDLKEALREFFSRWTGKEKHG